MKPDEFRTALRTLGVSQHQFARDAGIKVGTANRWATGKFNMPAIAQAYVRLLLYVHEFKEGRPEAVEEKRRHKAAKARDLSAGRMAP